MNTRHENDKRPQSQYKRPNKTHDIENIRLPVVNAHLVLKRPPL